MTKSKAIKAAREQVSELYRFGENYRFQIYKRRFHAWMETYPTDYWNAKRMRSQALIEKAREALGFTDGDQFVDYDGGRWVDYLD
tara:strand:+ start:1325 stop:1579 length:255 start_codon:yes stop_codon:yes gene_type:complete